MKNVNILHINIWGTFAIVVIKLLMKSFILMELSNDILTLLGLFGTWSQMRRTLTFSIFFQKKAS